MCHGLNVSFRKTTEATTPKTGTQYSQSEARAAPTFATARFHSTAPNPVDNAPDRKTRPQSQKEELRRGGSCFHQAIPAACRKSMHEPMACVQALSVIASIRRRAYCAIEVPTQ